MDTKTALLERALLLSIIRNFKRFLTNRIDTVEAGSRESCEAILIKKELHVIIQNHLFDLVIEDLSPAEKGAEDVE